MARKSLHDHAIEVAENSGNAFIAKFRVGFRDEHSLDRLITRQKCQIWRNPLCTKLYYKNIAMYIEEETVNSHASATF